MTTSYEIPTKFQGSRYPLTCAFIMGAGIDVTYVAAEGITVAGYEEFVLRPDGRRQLVGGDTLQTRLRRWPSLEFGLAVRFGMAVESLGAA